MIYASIAGGYKLREFLTSCIPLIESSMSWRRSVRSARPTVCEIVCQLQTIGASPHCLFNLEKKEQSAKYLEFDYNNLTQLKAITHVCDGRKSVKGSTLLQSQRRPFPSLGSQIVWFSFLNRRRGWWFVVLVVGQPRLGISHIPGDNGSDSTSQTHSHFTQPTSSARQPRPPRRQHCG
jgi:hypothetical protein